MKKLLSLLLALVMVFILAVCGNNGDTFGNTDKFGTLQGENNEGEAWTKNCTCRQCRK